MECSERKMMKCTGMDQIEYREPRMIRKFSQGRMDNMELRMTVMITKINRMGPTCGQAQMEFSERKMMNYG
ncbi:hypothetical protein DWY12_28075 [Enterocloster bolteae]|nr:hypothetical protein DWY12_28075 [Enterocloster bolteae]